MTAALLEGADPNSAAADYYEVAIQSGFDCRPMFLKRPEQQCGRPSPDSQKRDARGSGAVAEHEFAKVTI